MRDERIIDPNMHTFTLPDSNGEPHDYLVLTHPGGPGMDLVFELVSIGIGPVVEMLATFLGSDDIQKAIADDEGSVVESALRQLTQLDLSRVAAEIQKVLATGQVPDLLRKVLAHTQRDGKKLGEPRHYDAAWRGNYTEGLFAAWRVIEINGFFGPLRTLASLQSDLPSLPIPPSNGSTTSFGGSDSPHRMQ